MNLTPLLFFAGMLVVFWLFIVQPQRRRRQNQASLLGDLDVGDEVMTVGGIFGFVREVGENHVVLEIAPETRVRVAKSAVTARAEPAAETADTPETPLP
jgi:preprotein translocase subunit YajC